MFYRSTRLILAALGLLPAAWGQFKVAGREIQLHGFVQQGFAYSDENNFLTMKTSKGSFAFTDGAVNISSRLTDRFRVGAQLYGRNIGSLGDGKVEVDWAFGDYRFKDWFGVRAGKVKTALGLFSDTQDMEFLHTWALLPQSLYPLDLRSSTIAHIGADLYGEIQLKRLGSLGYTAYAGSRPDDARGGYRGVLGDAGLPPTAPISGRMEGADLKWNTPASGLTLGTSMMILDMRGEGKSLAAFGLPYKFQSKNNKTNSFYVDYVKGKLHLSGEYRRNWNVVALSGVFSLDSGSDTRGWFVAGSYRLSKRLEVGAYHSRFVSDWRLDHSAVDNHINDQTVTGRVDLTKFWSVKVEGHLMRGTGSPYSAHGFYQKVNPGGLKPDTNMLIVRTGLNF